MRVLGTARGLAHVERARANDLGPEINRRIDRVSQAPVGEDAAALVRTLPVICSSVVAVCCRLLACESVRADSSWLPCAMSREAE